MKTIITSIIILGLMFNLKAQNKYDFSFKVAANLENDNSIKLKEDFHISSALKVLISPQFDGLFAESYKKVKGISNFKNQFNDFDFGFNLGFKYEIIKALTITSVYNIGILKFNLAETESIQGAVMKATLYFTF